MTDSNDMSLNRIFSSPADSDATVKLST